MSKIKGRHGRKSMFTAEQIALLGTMSDYALSQRTGIKKQTIAAARIKRGIACFCPKNIQKNVWDNPENVAELGRLADKALADRLGVSLRAVQQARKSRGIAAYRPPTCLQWDAVKDLAQPDFYRVLRRAVPHASYRWLAERCFVSVSRAQKWFSPGTSQQPLSMQQRHHFYTTCLLESLGYGHDSD